MKKGYIAADFGASSGRLVLGTMEEGKLVLEEVYRFANEPVYANGHFYWDVLRLFHELKQGLKKVALRDDVEIAAIGIDTWGVDGAWLDKNGNLLANPVHYRDNRTTYIMEELESKLSEEALYLETGIQKWSYNTIYQMYHDQMKNEMIRQHADAWLFMPDLFGFFLTGQKYTEYTIATTGAIIDPQTNAYNEEVFNKLGLSMDYLQDIVMPGTVVGTLTKEVQEETGLGAVPVVAVGGHDTASAVAATPLASEQDVYLVCGTWCLMGMELDQPVKTLAAKASKLTNEGAVGGKTRLLKNINGLWFLQQLKKVWNEQGKDIDFPDIIREVKTCDHTYAVDATDERFMAPMNMEKEIIAYCEETYGVTLEGIGQVAKAAYNGLVSLYKLTVEQFEELTGKEVAAIRMIGGGIKDAYLCSQVAEVTGKPVTAGPVEASATGNLLMQMYAVGEIGSIEEARELVKQSFTYTAY